ncbi:MAG: pectate lyase, partial [Bryocella sp.]
VLTLAAAASVAQPDGALVDGTASEDYSFIPAALRARCRAAVVKANEIVLATQIRIDGKPTIWSQQNDPLTLKPASARNFEMPALSTGESASVVLYLMSLPRPTAAEVRSVEDAVAWFEANKMMGFTFSGGRRTPGGRMLHAVAGAGPLWARYYSLTSGKAIFGDRDKSIHGDVMEISEERRNGSGWYGGEPGKVLERFGAWKAGIERNRGRNVPRGTSKSL